MYGDPGGPGNLENLEVREPSLGVEYWTSSGLRRPLKTPKDPPPSPPIVIYPES